jgi:hypothetical protein
LCTGSWPDLVRDRVLLPQFDALEVEVMRMSIDVSFNKTMVCEIPIPAGPLLTGCCGGGWISGSVEDGVSREDWKAALWSLCTSARVCCCDPGPVGRPLHILLGRDFSAARLSSTLMADWWLLPPWSPAKGAHDLMFLCWRKVFFKL